MLQMEISYMSRNKVKTALPKKQKEKTGRTFYEKKIEIHYFQPTKEKKNNNNNNNRS